MKYQIGDLLLVKDIRPRARLLLHLDLLLHFHLHPRPHHRLNNTFGIITAAEKHTDIFEKDSTENDNGYVWYSQVDNKEYSFYENEVDCEVVK